jgi:hypothetical protein
MTILELDSLRQKISSFQQNAHFDADSKYDVKDYSKEDADSFMISPLKPHSKSLQSTLSFFHD